MLVEVLTRVEIERGDNAALLMAKARRMSNASALYVVIPA